MDTDGEDIVATPAKVMALKSANEYKNGRRRPGPIRLERLLSRDSTSSPLQFVSINRRRSHRTRSFEILERRRLLTTYVVDTTADVIRDDGLISLREAVLAASLNRSIGDVASGEPGRAESSDADVSGIRDHITFAPEIASIELRSPLWVTDHVSISADPQSPVTISGGGRHQILAIGSRLITDEVRRLGVEPSELIDASVELFSLNFRNGRARSGGAIASDFESRVVITDAVFSDNYADVGFTGSGRHADRFNSASITDAGYGGAISASGVLELKDVQFQNNRALRGGGAVRSGTRLMATDVRFEMNTAGIPRGIDPFDLDNITGDGVGGTHWSANGGGLLHIGESLAMERVTFANNIATASGGGAYVTPYQFEPSQHDVRHSEFDSNVAGWGTSIEDDHYTDDLFPFVQGRPVELTFAEHDDTSLIGDAPCDLPALLPSWEVRAVPEQFSAGSIGDLLNVVYGGGGLYIGGDAIVSHTSFRENRLAGPTVDYDFGEGETMARGGGMLAAGGTVTISDADFDSNSVVGRSGAGGGLSVGPDVELDGVRIQVSNNAAPSWGGGLEVFRDGSAAIRNSGLSNNVAGPGSRPGVGGNGGAAFVANGGDLTINNSTIAGNRADWSGGGVWVGDGTYQSTEVRYRENRAGAASGTTESTEPSSRQAAGGAVYNSVGTVTIAGGVMVLNRVEGDQSAGGAVFTAGRSFLDGLRLIGNRASLAGGAVVNLGRMDVTSVTLQDNAVAASFIAGSSASDGESSIGGFGGAIFNGADLHRETPANPLLIGARLDQVTIVNNRAGHGGGIANRGFVSAGRTSILENRATQGGGIWSRGGVRLTNATVTRNRAFSRGGGVFDIGGRESLFRSVTVARNRASSGGGIATTCEYDERESTYKTIGLMSTVVADNEADHHRDVAGRLKLRSGNLIGDADGLETVAVFGLFEEQPQDNLLGAPSGLGDFIPGTGPGTSYVRLSTDSPAVGLALPGLQLIDQTGMPRIGSRDDAGAVQSRPSEASAGTINGEDVAEGVLRSALSAPVRYIVPATSIDPRSDERFFDVTVRPGETTILPMRFASSASFNLSTTDERLASSRLIHVSDDGVYFGEFWDGLWEYPGQVEGAREGQTHFLVLTPSLVEQTFRVTLGYRIPDNIDISQFNAIEPTDVNGDGVTQPLDALAVLNHLRRTENGSPVPIEFQFPDVNDDGKITPVDALTVLNQLRRSRGFGEDVSATGHPKSHNQSAAVERLDVRVDEVFRSSTDWFRERRPESPSDRKHPRNRKFQSSEVSPTPIDSAVSLRHHRKIVFRQPTERHRSENSTPSVSKHPQPIFENLDELWVKSD